MKMDRADIVHGARRVVAATARASVTAANGVANAATGVAAPRRVQTSLVVVVVVIVARGTVIVARRARSARTIARRPASHIVGDSRDSPASACARDDARMTGADESSLHSPAHPDDARPTVDRDAPRGRASSTRPGATEPRAPARPRTRASTRVMAAPGDAAAPPPPVTMTTRGDGPDDEDDDEDDRAESFIDERAADYEEVADLDEDDEAPMSSDDEDDEEAGGEDDALMEDRDAAATATLSPDRDDAECVACAHAAPVYCVAWSCDRECATVASGGGDDKGYFRRGSEPARELRGHEESVSATAFSTDGALLATGGLDGRVCVFDGRNGELRRTLEGPGGGIEWVAWHPRGRVCLAGSEDFTAWMWNGDDGALMQVFSGHSERVSCGGFTPDGKQVVTGSYDGSLRVWQPRTGACEHLFRGHPFHDGPLTCVAFHSSTPGLTITGSEDNTARLVSTTTGKVLAPLVAHTETIESVGFCDVMPLAATGSLDGNIIIWDTNSCQSRGTLTHDGGVSTLRWIPNTTCLYRYVQSACARASSRLATKGPRAFPHVTRGGGHSLRT